MPRIHSGRSNCIRTMFLSPLLMTATYLGIKGTRGMQEAQDDGNSLG